MPELRWVLIALGVLFLAGLALWEWRRSRRRPRHPDAVTAVVEPPEPRMRRAEPGIEGFAPMRAERGGEDLEVPTIHPVEPVRLGVSAEAAVDVPAAAMRAAPAPDAGIGPSIDHEVEGDLQQVTPSRDAPTLQPAGSRRAVPIQWPPARTEQVLNLRVVPPPGGLFAGRQLRIALEGAGLVPGPQTIFHRVDERGAVLVSAANMVRPGSLDPAVMDAQDYRGVSLFSILPGPLPPERMLEELVAVARALAHRMGAAVQDERGAELDAARLIQLRRSLPASEGAGEAP